jgi:phosphatidylserine/phosphatidylglycerophosphate/cardiolipin synthase-like enzyme
MLKEAGMMVTLIAAVGWGLAHHRGASVLASVPPPGNREIFFAPERDLPQIDVAILRGARQSFEIAMYSFTDRRIARELLDACQRAVTVYLYRDREQYESEKGGGSEVPQMLRGCSGIHVRVKGSQDLMHLKAFVADDSMLRDGSSNWSISAARYKDNEIIFVSDRAEMQAFREDFAAMCGGEAITGSFNRRKFLCTWEISSEPWW